MIHYLLIALAFVSLEATANQSPPAKLVALPFNNEFIISANHTGLFFGYDMHGNASKKIICNLSNAYNSWFVYYDHLEFKKSRFFSQHHTIIFSSKDEDTSKFIFHADAAGSIKINEILHYKAINATASCYYDADIKISG